MGLKGKEKFNRDPARIPPVVGQSMPKAGSSPIVFLPGFVIFKEKKPSQ
jgi:hypothetical protein